MYGQDRDSMRLFFADAWRKAAAGEALEPMERIVAGVISEHPEYHDLLANPDTARLDRDYRPEDGETNPFLHMGMHIALREQAGADRPPGIRALIDQIAVHLGDLHAAEHELMEPLGEALWRAQRDSTHPDEATYLEAVRNLASRRTGRPPAA